MAASSSKFSTSDFRPVRVGNAEVDKLYTGCRWAEGPAYFAAGQLSDLVRTSPNDRMLRLDGCSGAVSSLSGSQRGIRTAILSTARAAS